MKQRRLSEGGWRGKEFLKEDTTLNLYCYFYYIIIKSFCKHNHNQAANWGMAHGQ